MYTHHSTPQQRIPPMFANTRFMLSLLTAALLLMTSLWSVQDVHAAKLYKWVDENGTVHYSQIPPPNKFRSKKKKQAKETQALPTPAEYCDKVAKFSVDTAVKMQLQDQDKAVQNAPAALRLNATEIVNYIYRFQASKPAPNALAEKTHKACLGGQFRRGVQLAKPSRDGAKGSADGERAKPKKRHGGPAFGTGWPLGDRYVVTNEHVVGSSRTVKVMRTDGVRLDAKVIAKDKVNDLALLLAKQKEKLPPGLQVSAEHAGLGEEVFTIGFPHIDLMGVEPKLTTGIINAVTGLRDDKRFFQISVAVQSGNSGGPLFNMQGEVVGVVTAKLNAVALMRDTGELLQDVSFAVKGERIHKFLSKRLEGGIPKGRNLPPKGANLAALAKQLRDSVLMVIVE